MDRFARFGLGAGLVGAVLLAIGAALGSIGATGPFSQQVETRTFVVASVLRLLGGIGMLLGLGGLTARCAARGSTLLFGGYLIAAVGLVLNLGWIWTDLFVSDTFAKVAPAVLDGDGAAGTRLDTGSLVAWLANLGLALLAVGVARTRTVPRSSWIALFIAGAITLVPLPFDGEIYEVFIGLPFAVAMGAAVLPRRAQHPSLALSDVPA